MSTRLPPLLAPYLTPPPPPTTPLLLLTTVLGATANWLVLRFLGAALGHQPTHAVRAAGGGRGGARGGDPAATADELRLRKVVLVSFLRDAEFWKDGARRLNLDLDKAAASKHFAFVDGLSDLFTPTPASATAAAAPGRSALRGAEVHKVYETILAAVRSLEADSRDQSQVLLVMDHLDLLLAATQISAVEMGELVMDLREHVQSTVLTVSADEPLVLAQQTPLEKKHAAFLLSIAHQADLTMSLRLLDTGKAKDVSGVVRVTVGDDVGHTAWEERELLYFVGADGGANVFERGQ